MGRSARPPTNLNRFYPVEAAGIRDIRTKALRSNNPCNVVRATMQGLMSLRTLEEVAKIRGKAKSEIL